MSRSKAAGINVTQTPTAARDFQHERFNALARIAALSLGIGAGTAGAMALPKMMDATPDDNLEEPQDNYVTIGNIQPKKLVHKYPLPKVAEAKPFVAPPPGAVGGNLKSPGNILSNSLSAIMKLKDSVVAAAGPVKDRIVEATIPAEDNASPLTGVYGVPLMAAAAAIPAYAGYKGVNSLLNHFSQDTRQAELDEAKRKFEKARAAQYAAMMRQKSGVDAVYANREVIKESLDKRAEPDILGLGANTYGKAIGSVTGMPDKEAWKSYLGTILAGMGAAGVGGYAVGKGLTSPTNQEQLKKKILKQRAAQLADSSYAALPATYAIPTESRTLKAATITNGK